ncbi:MAG: hypothetical protein ABIQ81_00130 [Novosphingobium sp.]
MSGGHAKPWLRRVALAAVSGMSDSDVEQCGFQIMLDAMRAAYAARYPTPERPKCHCPAATIARVERGGTCGGGGCPYGGDF